MKRFTSILHIKRPFLFGFAVFIIVASLTQYLVFQDYLITRKSEQKETIKELHSIKDRLQVVLSNNLAATQTLAFIVRKYGIPTDFDNIAQTILSSNKNIDVIQLNQKGVITHVYPLKGNEAVIGYDVLADPTRNKEALTAIEKEELFFAGPINLKQGGVGIVGRLPIFIDHKFWGFSCVVVRISTLFKAIEIDSTNKSRFIYQVSKINPNTNQPEFFLPNEIHLSPDETVSVHIPDGDWTIYVKLKKQSTLLSVTPLSLLGFVFACIAGLFCWFMATQPTILDKLVKEKAEQIISAEHQITTTLARVSDAVVSLDRNWRYTYLNDVALLQHPQGRDATVGKIIWEVHPGLKQTIFWDKYHEAMNTNKPVEFEDYYAPLDTWFSVKVYPSLDGITIFYRDISLHKKAEQRILIEKTLSESIINSLPGVFYLYNRNGEFLRWNKNFESVSGYASEEVQHMKPLDFFDIDEQKLLQEKIDRVFEEGHSDVEAHFFTKDKKRIPYYFNGHRIRFNNIDYLIGVGIDLTQRRRLEELIIKANSLARIGGWEVDIIKETMYWSDITKEIFEAEPNYTPTLESRLQFYKAGDSRVKMMEKITAALETGQSWDEEYPIITLKNNERWVRTIGEAEFKDGKCIKLLGSFQDIDQRKKAEIKLAASEAFNKGILRSLSSHIAVLNHNGEIIESNHAWNNFALEHGETTLARTATGTNYFDVCKKAIDSGDKIATTVLQGMKDVLSGVIPLFYLEYPLEGMKESYWYAMNVVKFKSGEEMIVVSYENITERKLVEQEREKVTQDLTERNKNIDQFSYIVSHNLRAPVANILGLCELVKLEYIDAKDLPEVMDALLTAAQKLDEVIMDMNEILQVRNMVFENKELVSFKTILRDITLSIENVIAHQDILIESDFSAAAEMHSIKPYIHSIFYNLIYNSIKYRRPEIGLKVSIRSETTPTGLKLRFRDNGLGIDLEKHGENLFGLYKRFHLHAEGKGLGLFMVKTQLETLGGRISVTSEVNQWTEFVIEFEQ
ncbi:MAG: PAS domain-containing protein [Bacteroidota bacterium]